jgi:hypothetical protein
MAGEFVGLLASARVEVLYAFLLPPYLRYVLFSRLLQVPALRLEPCRLVLDIISAPFFPSLIIHQSGECNREGYTNHLLVV